MMGALCEDSIQAEVESYQLSHSSFLYSHSSLLPLLLISEGSKTHSPTKRLSTLTKLTCWWAPTLARNWKGNTKFSLPAP